MATVSALTYYPVKGCAGIAVSSARCTPTGIVHDRSFMVVDAEDGTFLSQRRTPAMAVIRPTFRADGARLMLAAPDTDEAEIDVSFDGDRREVSLFGKWFGVGVDQGDTVAKWFSSVLDRPCRLVRVSPDHDRDGWGEHPGKVGFADAHAVLVTAESSLAELNRRIRARSAAPVPMNRFRPNVVVSGWPDPFTEDRVRLLRVGTVELGYATRAVRCQVPTVDQETGRKAGPEPTRTLADFRRERELGGVSFGMKAAVLMPGDIAVGDEITVRRWQAD
ncbi:MAG TPA: MOSC N-terminal beta barrel domain-containing protein [Pseudonocardiaceae bacterium]|nr:MOSC N-terminal beta barrel domain-containing protein [Pseudonocardiaceae bacterium]